MLYVSVLDKAVEKNKLFYVQKSFPENRAVYGIMSRNMVDLFYFIFFFFSVCHSEVFNTYKGT